MKTSEHRKEYLKKYLRKWQKENKDKVAANNKKYLSKPEAKEKKQKYRKEYRNKNREEIKEKERIYRETHKDQIRKRLQNYAKSEEGKIVIDRIRIKRLLKKKNLKNNLSIDEWKHAIEYFEGKCAYCGNKTKNPHKEHFIPVSKDGEFTKYNIIPACKTCNSSKHANDPLNWLINRHNGIETYNKIMKYFNSLK